MVRAMKWTGRARILALGVIAVAAGGVSILGSHVFTTSRAPAAARCSNDPRLALGCDEQRYRSIVAGQGVAEAFADLKAGYGADPEMQRLCHAITHAIGQAAVAKYGDVAEAFRHGDNACGSGYYHGVMQGFALARGSTQLLSDLDAACAGVPGKERKSLDYFNCVHGLGHAIMAVRRDGKAQVPMSRQPAVIRFGRGAGRFRQAVRAVRARRPAVPSQLLSEPGAGRGDAQPGPGAHHSGDLQARPRSRAALVLRARR